MRRAASVAMSSSGLSSNSRLASRFWRVRRTLLLVGKGSLLVLFLTFFLSLRGPALASTSVHPSIERISIEGLRSISREELLYLLDLSERQPLDPAKVRAGIKRAFLKSLFDDIRIETVSATPLHILVAVRERERIVRIDFTGLEAIPAHELATLPVQKTDDRYRASLAQQSCRKIEEALLRHGYAAAKVHVSLTRSEDGVSLVFSLADREPTRISSLTIDDPSDALPHMRGLEVGDLFDKTTLDALLEKTKNTLAKRRHINNTIEAKYGGGNLLVRVIPGAVLDIEFVGNSALGNSALRKETTFFEVNAFNEYLIEESIMRMRHQYRQIGYQFAEIVPVVERKEGEILLTYYIDEGVRQKVKTVTFSGNTIAEQRLLKQLSFAPGEIFNPDLVEANRESLQHFYLASGYLAVRIDTPQISRDDEGVVIVFPIDEGAVTRVSEIVITGNRAVQEDTLRSLIPLKSGDPYSDDALGSAKLKIGDWYVKKGFADVTIDVDRIIGGNTASVRIVIHEGGQSRFGKQVIVGNDKTRAIVLQRELMHKEGDPYNPGVFLEERVALNRTGLFSSIDIASEPNEQGVRDIVYKVQEAPAGALEFGFGYAEYDQFRTFLDVSYRNLWGMNRQVQFRADVSSILKRATLSYYHPWAFEERDLAFKAALIVENKKELNSDNHSVLYRSDRYGINAGFEKKFSPELKAELMYDLANVRTYDVTEGVILSKEDVGTLLISGMHLSVTYDKRDNAVDPTRGFLLGGTYKLTGPYLFSETNFSKAVLFANTYQSLSKRIVAALSVRGGIARGFGETKDVPIVERFFLGGRTSVRGYQQDLLGPKDSLGNPIGGEAFLMGNFELRIKLWKDLGVVPFVDVGNVWRRADDLSLTNLKYTAGLGFRYNTPVGPIRVDYGRKLNREEGESHGAFHFSIGHAF